MVSNSAKLDHRTKQHTQFGVSASNGSRDMARTKSWRKKRKKKEKNNEANCTISNSAKLDSRTKQHTQSGVSTSDGSRDIAATKSWRKKKRKEKKNEHWRNYIASPTRITNNNMGKLSCNHIGGFILFSFEKWLSGPLHVGKLAFLDLRSN